ncbi:MAG: hypothetical protein RLZZ66_2436 [Pseudomonadota bacterium]|jgi:hypothetical protein
MVSNHLDERDEAMLEEYEYTEITRDEFYKYFDSEKVKPSSQWNINIKDYLSLIVDIQHAKYFQDKKYVGFDDVLSESLELGLNQYLSDLLSIRENTSL